MDYSWLTNPVYLEYLWEGFINTMILLVVSGILGFALAIALALSQITGPRPLAWLARGITTVVRGTPLLLQLFFFYDGVGRLLPQIEGIREMWIWPILRDPFFYGILTFTVSVGAYAGEVIRGAMLSVPRGELEAARAFGMSRFKILYRIWLPHAIQICLPTLTGEIILLLKSVPLVSTIAVMDLLQAANIVRDETFLVYEPLLLIAGIYIAMTMVLTLGMRAVERNFPGVRPAGGTAR
ncbi:ABC transporter permease [Halofilum ochraceum]|uniref:ABC transporter permease n=1 Tax=Halofilum ochraceum TaxID=1611323 RepID=UPI00082AC22F|nr:ABC transporter permease subunit [Halofilum ochraceum]